MTDEARPRTVRPNEAIGSLKLPTRLATSASLEWSAACTESERRPASPTAYEGEK